MRAARGRSSSTPRRAKPSCNLRGFQSPPKRSRRSDWRAIAARAIGSGAGAVVVIGVLTGDERAPAEATHRRAGVLVHVGERARDGQSPADAGGLRAARVGVGDDAIANEAARARR